MTNEVFIVAELSANHNHNFDLAVDSIRAIAETGADAVKFQTYTPDSLTLDVNNEYFGPRASGLWKGMRLYDIYREGSLPYEWHADLKSVANECGLVCFSTPFDKPGVDFLEKLEMPIYKVASLEITDIPLIRYIASKHKPMIISTGVAGLEDIELVLKVCQEEGNTDITLLKCTSEYPACIEDANLLTIPDMKVRFGVEVGVSDHSLTNTIPVTAVALGASIVEKHFILDRNLGGLDAAFSLNREEFASMVKEIRLVEKALGQVDYMLADKDKLRRRSLFFCQDIKARELITSEHIKSVRPGYGLSPLYIDGIIGKCVLCDKKKGEPVRFEDIF